MKTQKRTGKRKAKASGQAAPSQPMVPASAPQELDTLSRQILALLQEDGRRSFSSIARELKVSEGSVRSRVGYLEEHEHLRFIAVIDPVHAGYLCWAMLGINVAPGVSPNDLALQFSQYQNAIWVSVMGGRFDLMVETWTESPAKLQDFLEEYCYGDDRIAAVETMIGMRIYKWGAPQV